VRENVVRRSSASMRSSMYHAAGIVLASDSGSCGSYCRINSSTGNLIGCHLADFVGSRCVPGGLRAL
jgi:hypothetical protein